MSGKVKVVFLFMSRGAAVPGEIKEWNPTHQCDPAYIAHHSKEGYIKLLGSLYDSKWIDDLKIFYESNRGHGLAEFYPGVYGEVVPHFSFIDKYIDDDTIIFARGGFKGWHDWLKAKKGKNWLVIYAANTGREKWPWWDIVLHDLKYINEIDGLERYWHYFIKPIDQTIFRPTIYEDKYDICIGASHIHEKKGQWAVIDAMIEAKEKHSVSLRAVLPGSFQKGVNTNQIIEKIKKHDLDVFLPGMVSREELCKIFNSSRYFVCLTSHGQNDRGPLEAMACGTPVVIMDIFRHSPIVWDNLLVSSVVTREKKALCRELIGLTKSWNHNLRLYTYKHFIGRSDFQKVICPRMSLLFEIMSKRKPDFASKIYLKTVFGEIDERENINNK